MSRPNCPDCGGDLSPAGVCGSCGYRERGGSKAPIDPNAGLCAHLERGLRCSEAGSLSTGLRGMGPWYCARHFPPFVAAGAHYEPAVPSLPLGKFSAAEQQAKAEFPKPANGQGTWWAKRILRLVELGEKLPHRSVEIAKEVLGRETKQEEGA